MGWAADHWKKIVVAPVAGAAAWGAVAAGNAVDATKDWVGRHPAITGFVAGCVAGSTVPVVGTVVGCATGASIGYTIGSDERAAEKAVK